MSTFLCAHHPLLSSGGVYFLCLSRRHMSYQLLAGRAVPTCATKHCLETNVLLNDGNSCSSQYWLIVGVLQLLRTHVPLSFRFRFYAIAFDSIRFHVFARSSEKSCRHSYLTVRSEIIGLLKTDYCESSC